MTLLAIDTSGAEARLALGAPDGTLLRELRAPGGRTAGTGLPGLLAALAAELPGGLRALAAVGVATGPGSFTGLRVGLASAKTLAWTLGLPVAGIPTGDALRRAAARHAGPDALACAVLRPAGLRERSIDLPGVAPVVRPVDADLTALLAGRGAIAVGGAAPDGVPGLPGWSPADLGTAAEADLGAALVALLAARIAAGRLDDPATLVPVYVTAPRGADAAEEARWSPDLV